MPPLNLTSRIGLALTEESFTYPTIQETSVFYATLSEQSIIYKNLEPEDAKIYRDLDIEALLILELVTQ